MRNIISMAALSALSFSVPASAQLGDQPLAVTKKFPCPPSGYFPPMYGIVGRNAGDGPAPTEAMSPCTPPEVEAAAEAIGMARTHYGSPLSLKAVITIMFTAKGTFAVDGRTPVNVDQLDYHAHFGLPALRLMIRTGAKFDGRVLNDDYGWREVSEGGAGTPDPKSRSEMLDLIKLTPFGAMWSVIEAEGHAVVSKVDGKTVLRGASPYDQREVTVTLDAMNRPETVRVVDGANTYGATFAEYRNDFEPNYLLIFPRRITWTKNGRPFADLTVTAYKTNPYVVFPVPASVRRTAAK